MTGGQTPLWLRRTVVAGLLGGLLLLGFVVMQPFLTAIAWAAILSRTFKVSNDIRFEEKLTDIVGLYRNPPEPPPVLHG